MKLKPPLSEKDVKKLSIEDDVELNGRILTARDAAHERILREDKIPFSLKGSVIYHCGPLIKIREGRWGVISAGPTTSSRLSKFIPKLLEKHEIRALIGKGGLSEKAIDVLSEKNCVYLSYTGGAAALAAKSIKRVKNVYWEDLGMPEAVWELLVKNFPCTVSIDTEGNCLY